MSYIEILLAGIDALQEYLSAHVLTCLIPAFFIAGAIAVFISQKAVLKYFGVRSKKYVSYTIASLAGTVLAVCSCTVLPLFASIYKRGAGIGPAITFLFSGPAINILAVILTARVLGFELGVARVIGAVFMAIIIGLIMAFVFKKEDASVKESSLFQPEHSDRTRPMLVSLTFFILLVVILVIGAADTDVISLYSKLVILLLLILGTLGILYTYFAVDELKQWLSETWILAKRIIPILLLGVFVIGVIGGAASLVIPGTTPTTAIGVATAPYLGDSSVGSCFLAAVIGAILYMPTLLEVAIVGDLFGYSSGLMDGGPALALLLAGPSLSLPNMIVITRVIGVKKAFVYLVLVVGVATVTGLIYGVLIGLNV